MITAKKHQNSTPTSDTRKPLMKITFHDDGSCTLTMDRSRLSICQTEGFAFCLPGKFKVRLFKDFFITTPYQTLEEESKTLYQFFVPVEYNSALRK